MRDYEFVFRTMTLKSSVFIKNGCYAHKYHWYVMNATAGIHNKQCVFCQSKRVAKYSGLERSRSLWNLSA